MVVDGVDPAQFGLWLAGQVAVVKGSREEERCEGADNAGDYHEFERGFHLSDWVGTHSLASKNSSTFPRISGADFDS